MGRPHPYIRRLELGNIRGFDRLELDFGTSDRPRMQTVVIGRNGTCKTTLLRAIALGLAQGNDIAALLSISNGRWVAEGKDHGIIRLYLGSLNERPCEIIIKEPRGGDLISPRGEISCTHKPVFLCGYGVGRGGGDNGGEPGRDYRAMDSVMTLFRYDRRLVTSELVLRRLWDYLGTERFHAVLAGLKHALGLGPDHQIELPRGGGVEITGPDLGGRISLEGWADGYRMTFLWMIDFYGWAMRADAFDEDGEVNGILLIDELEQHLHPAMQKELLGKLEQALPKVQFVATTHSPLVALSATAEHLVALHRNGPRIQRAAVPNLTGYSAEDVLVEEALFGTGPYAPGTSRQLDLQLELARIAPEERSPEQAAKLRRLSKELDPGRTPALRDDRVVARLERIEALLSRKGPGG